MTEISDKTVEAVARAIAPFLTNASLPYDEISKLHAKPSYIRDIARNAITALLASGEVAVKDTNLPVRINPPSETIQTSCALSCIETAVKGLRDE